jgi:hypothetical protein
MDKPKTVSICGDDWNKLSGIEKWAYCTMRHEGWYEGSRSYRNNNPGNLIYNSFTRDYLGAKVESDGRFAKWDTYEKGFNALVKFLTWACLGELRSYTPEMTLLEFYGKYAPSSDGNYPMNYAKSVADDLGVTINFRIRDFEIQAQNEPESEEDSEMVEIPISGQEEPASGNSEPEEENISKKANIIAEIIKKIFRWLIIKLKL